MTQAPASTELFDGKLSGAPTDERVCPKTVGHNAEPNDGDAHKRGSPYLSNPSMV